MTFIIKTDVAPTVTNLPKFEFVKADPRSILTNGSLCLVTADELQIFGGKSMLNLIVGSNLAESTFRQNYSLADVNVNIWSSTNSSSDIDAYVQMTAVENGLKFTTSGNPATAKLGLLKFMSEANMRAVLTTAKDIYLDVWITPLQYPTMLGNTSKDWTECAIAKIGGGSTPTSADTRITANYVNLQTTDTKWYTKSDTTLGHQYTDGSYVLNEPKFMAASQTLEAYNQAENINAYLLGQIHASVLEGGYMSQDFILHSIYAEDLTKSGRTANEVAAIRKLQFDQYFQV